MAATSNAYIFSSLEKFSEGNGAELSSFLSKFDRCCLIGNKVDANDAPVKGQLLMLFVEGRARATLEEYEQTQGGVQQTYAALAAKLREHFDNEETRENSMSLFEARIKKINESEEEFMLALLMLYKTANPNHDAAVTLLAVKRKFLSGISPTLRNNIFVFCQDPFAAGVTREQLLTHCRKARNLLLTQNADSNQEYSTDRVLANNTNGNNSNTSGQILSEEGVLAAAINNLTMTVQEHITSTDDRFQTMGEAIAAVSGGGGFQRNNYGSRGRGGNRGGRSNYSNTGNRGGYNNNNNSNSNSSSGRGNNRRGRGGRGPIVCYNCGGANHVARDCRGSRSSGNC